MGIRGLRTEKHSYLREGISRLCRVLCGARGLAALLRQFATHFKYRYSENAGKVVAEKMRLNEYGVLSACVSRVYPHKVKASPISALRGSNMAILQAALRCLL